VYVVRPLNLSIGAKSLPYPTFKIQEFFLGIVLKLVHGINETAGTVRYFYGEGMIGIRLDYCGVVILIVIFV
jgi:hypothetical protein